MVSECRTHIALEKRYRSFLIVLIMAALLLSVESGCGSAYFSLLLQPSAAINSPSVLLQDGTAGSGVIYANNTSAKVSTSAPAPPTYYPNNCSIVSGNWYNPNWSYRKKITANHAQVQANLTAFPVLINQTSDSDLASHAQSNGNDILFAGSNGVSKLGHEIEKYTSATGALVAWVKVPSLSSSVDTDLYMYYGNPTCGSQQDAVNVWDTNYKGVWHLKEDPSGTAPQMKDSTSNGNNGTSSGSMTTSDQVTGKIDGSLDFDGSNDEIICGNSASLQITTEITIEAWASTSSTGASRGIVSKHNGNSPYPGYQLRKYSDDYYRFMTDGTGQYIASDSAYTDSGWHYIVGVRRNGINYLYIDGAQQTATSTYAITESGVNFDIGRGYSNYNGFWWLGDIDEVRVSNSGRNASWIGTCYNNQNSPSSFYSVGIQEGNPKVSGTLPTSVQTVDSDYFVVRSAVSADSTIAYNPSGYNLIGSTTLVSGTINDLTSNNNVYMTYRSYTNNDVRYAESLGQSDTTSTTYQDKVTLTFTPPVAGDYVIIADAEVHGSSGTYNSLARLYIGTSTYQESIRSIKDTGDWYPFNALKRLSLSAATTMSIQFRSSSGFATASIRNARLIALRVSSEYAESEGRSTTTSTSWQNKATLTFTPATAGDYLIIATSNVDGSSTLYDVKWRLLQDGTTEHANVARRPGASAGRYNVGAMRTIALSAASHNFTIQYCSSSTSGTAGISYAHFVAIRVDQFPNKYYQESEGESSPAVAGTWYDKVASTYTPQAGDHLIIGTIHHTSADTANSVGIRLVQNGSTITDRLIEQTATTDYESTFSFTKASLTATSTSDAVQYMGESTATRVKMARILSLQLFEHIVEVEFTGSSNTETWAQLAWRTDTAWTAGSVTVTTQVYNYTLGGYPTSGNGYDSYTSSSTASTDEARTQTITTNPTHFRNSTGYWRIKLKGVKTTITQFDFKADWVEFKPTHSEYTVSTEFLFSGMTTNAPTQLNFTVVSEYTITGVSVTIQVWNYSSSTYVTSGQGYVAYTSSGSNETKLLSINANPQFHASNGSARVKVTGVKTTTIQYQQKVNQIKLVYSYVSDNVEDYVDNNTSNVDSSVDKGTHGNFTAQQYGPDSVYDTLTEENVGSIVYENSAENNSTAGQSSHSFSYSLQRGTGNNRLVVVTVSWEDAEATASISSLTFGGTAMTKVADVTVGTGYSEYISLWYLLDSSLPGSAGSYTVAVAVSESIIREIYVALAEYSGVKQSAPDDYDTHANTVAGNTAITLTAAADGSVVVAGVGEGGPNVLTNTNNINNLQEQLFSSSGSALGHHTNANSGNITVGWNNLNTREGMAGAVWQPASNYNLDLEVQWTSTTYNMPNEQLCIYGGTMGAENIRVDAWTGSTWQNLFTDLSGGWNNVSVSSYLTSSTFTIRFKGGTETLDSTQDTWNIDATLLHSSGWTADFNYVLKLTEVGGSNWKVRLKAYGQSNINRLKNSSIYLYDGSNSTQIVILNGAYSQSIGPWYNLTASDVEYIWMHVETSNPGTSYVYAYLEILSPNTTTYARYIIAFKMS